jgi:hypothetical protein
MPVLTDPSIKTVTSLNSGDILYLVDVLDLSSSPAGTSAKITKQDAQNSFQDNLGDSAFEDIATDVEIFQKNNQKPISAEGLFNSPFFHQWAVNNTSIPLTQLVPTGTPTAIGFNILTPLLEANEVKLSNIPLNFKNIANVNQLKILNETTNKLLFPSNLNTFNNTFVAYSIRINLKLDFSALSNNVTVFYLNLRRFVDDSIIASYSFVRTDFPAVTDFPLTHIINTFVATETDPFVVDGCYIDILNDSNSAGTVTLKSVQVTIFKT